MKTPLVAFGLALALPLRAHDEPYQNPVDKKSLSEQEKYHNPVDQQTYVAPGGWKTYGPQGSGKPASGKVDLVDVRLLQSQEEIGAHTTAQELASFVDRAHKAARDVFASYSKPALLLVQFTCVPDSCPANIAYQGELSRELLQAYYDRLKQLPPLRVSGEVKFQFTLKVQP
jgi:hypothetical protein